MIKRFASVIALAGIAATGIAFASGSNESSLGVLQTEGAVLKSQVQNAKFRVELKKLNEELKGRIPLSGQSAFQSPSPGARSGVSIPNTSRYGFTGAGESSVPRVLSIYGKPSHLVASIAVPGGGSMDVVRGDTLPGHYRVVALTPSGVEVYKHGHRKWLHWGNGEQRSRSSAPMAIPVSGAGTMSNPFGSGQ